MIAVGKPYRSGDSLFVRAKLGHDGVSIMRPIRVGNALMFRGLDCEGKVVYGYPFRSGNELRVRTIYHTCAGVANPPLPGAPCSSGSCGPAYPAGTFREKCVVAVSGFAGSVRFTPSNGPPLCCGPEDERFSYDMSVLNGVYVLDMLPPGSTAIGTCGWSIQVPLAPVTFTRSTCSINAFPAIEIRVGVGFRPLEPRPVECSVQLIGLPDPALLRLLWRYGYGSGDPAYPCGFGMPPFTPPLYDAPENVMGFPPPGTNNCHYLIVDDVTAGTVEISWPAMVPA